MPHAGYAEIYRRARDILDQRLPAYLGLPLPEPGVASDNTADLADINRTIDHTLLKPDATAGMIRQLCQEARQYRFRSVCVAPYRVRLAAACLEGTGVKVGTVIGFPHGNSTTLVKVTGAVEAVARGAGEVDMVINIGALKDGDLKSAWEDIRNVKEAVGPETTLKVILETALLEDEEKVLGTLVTARAGADFVKTSTGFAGGGATVADVQLLRWTVGDKIGVKASGGIRDLDTAVAMIQAGASRLGTSAGVRIAEEFAARGNRR